MANTTQAIKTIDRLERLTNDKEGNPRWRVSFTDGSSAITKPGAACVYSINNRVYQDVPIRVELTNNNRIVSIATIPESDAS